MLKFKVNEDEYKKLDEKLQELYEGKDGSYQLKLDGGDDLTGLKQHAEKLLDEKKKEADKRRELEAKLTEMELKKKEEEEKLLLEKGEFEKVLEQKQKEFELKEKALVEKAEQAQNQMKDTLLNLEVTKVATELAGERAELITPHLQNRFDIVEKDGKLEVVIKDATGLPNPAMTADALIEEFKANELFEPIIKGRNSSGGGAGGGSGGGGAGGSEWEQYFDPANASYNITKQVELEKDDKTLHDSLRKKFNLDNPMEVAQRRRVGLR